MPCDFRVDRHLPASLCLLTACICWSLSIGLASAEAPSVKKAITLAPVQKDVDYDRPSTAEVAKCTIRAEKRSGKTAWVVRDPQGQTLRVFADTKGDNVVDQWSYYRDGLEVYRDIDSNFNGKADQFRWFHTAGSRWGLDRNEDGGIDTWKQISAEEATAELIAAMRGKDLSRFQRLLLTADELKQLGLGSEHAKELAAKVKQAPGKFGKMVKGDQDLTSSSKFVDFGGSQPGVVPAGARGSKRDLLVYENIAALVETKGKHQQIHVGTLIHVAGAWRLIDVPKLDDASDANDAGHFFQASLSSNRASANTSANGPDEKTQELMTKLEKLENEAAKASPANQQKINAERADILELLATGAKGAKEREQWTRQFADMASAAVQTNTFDDGVKRLQAMETRLLKSTDTKQLGAFVRYRRMTAEYGQNLQAKDADFAKVQEQWLKDLTKFVTEFPKSEDSGEALLQLAIAEEFAGKTSEAVKWYERIVKDFPTSDAGQKAAGARRRLRSAGKMMELSGEGLHGKPVDIARYRGKVVLVQYWATWCEPCVADMARIKELHARYAKKGFAVIGVNLDSDDRQAKVFLKTHKLPWTHIREEGGLDSRPANEMGILTLPTMILVDQKGRVAHRNIHVTELDAELKKLIR